MRDLWIAVGIIVVVFVGNFLLKGYYESSGSEIMLLMDELSYGIQSDSDNEKERKVELIKEKWDNTQKYWILFQYHERVNSMEDILLECLDSYQDKDEEEFHRALDKLKRNMEDLKNREEFSILNIL